MSASFSADSLDRVPPHARRLLVVMHLPFIAFTIAQAAFGLCFGTSSDPSRTALAFALVVVACAIQLRHSLAAAAGVRPSRWPWTLFALAAIAYVPAPLFGARWASLQWFVLASLAMLLRGKLAAIAIVASLVADSVWDASQTAASDIVSAPLLVWATTYWIALQLLGGVGLYGAARCVRLLDELRDARADLAELAVNRERLRIARDLHDLLGQSLSAVSLKGDLAIRLLARDDAPRAIGEIESLTSVARSALRDVLSVAQRGPPIALSAEIERAVDLLASTGTETFLDIYRESLDPSVDELFAWALREGVTNVLRHSSATTCAIRIARHEHATRLEIVNDGAMPVTTAGSGLSGLAARAAALSGEVRGRATGDGTFRLTVEIPEVAS